MEMISRAAEQKRDRAAGGWTKMKLGDKANRARSAFSVTESVMNERNVLFRGWGDEEWLDRSAIAYRNEN